MASTLVLGIALLGGALAVGSAELLFSDDTKSPLGFSDPKGTPIPTPSAITSADDWTIVPPEERTDIEMIDITEAKLFLPDSDDAANCESGVLDPSKAEKVIRDWLDKHRADLENTSVWEGTSILVTCSYPNDEFGGLVALYIGIPYDGYSYVAPDKCTDKARVLEPDDPLPAECIPPVEIDAPVTIDSHVVLAPPEEVLK